MFVDLLKLILYLRLAFFAVGVIAIIVNTIRYVSAFRKSLVTGCFSLKTLLLRIPESIRHTMIYESTRLFTIASIAFHISILVTMASHLTLYVETLTIHPSINALAPPSKTMAAPPLAASLLGALLLYRRGLRFSKGLAGLKITIITLHGIAQAIFWMWILSSLLQSRVAVALALLDIEILHAYMFTWVGFHAVMYILRLYHSTLYMRQPSTIVIGSGRACRR